MAFGKDNKNLGSVAAYGGTARQQAANAGRRRKRGSSGGTRPYWIDTFRPSLTAADSVRLIPGEYKVTRVDENNAAYEEMIDWYEYREHFHGGLMKGGICSGGPYFFDRKLREDCHGCEIFWNTPKAAKGQRKIISMTDKFAFRVIDFGTFHNVPQTDDKGQYKLNPETQQPYMNWAKCTGLGCTGCQVAQENKVGHIQPWPMSKTHFQSLNGYSDSIGACCTTCCGRGVISACMWQCGNHDCGDLIFDMSQTTATQDQIDDIVNAPYTCATCQVTGYPEEVIECSNCTPQGAEPNRASIFDVDMQIKAQKTGDGDTTALLVLATSDPKPLDTQFEEMLQYAPDLAKRFAPTPLEEQARIWNIQASKPDANPQSYAQGYGQGSPQQ